MCGIESGMEFFTDYGVPTSVDFVRSNPCQIVVSYTSSRAILFDTETGKSILELNSTLTSGMCREYVTKFAKGGLIYASNFLILKRHNFICKQAIGLKFSVL